MIDYRLGGYHEQPAPSALATVVRATWWYGRPDSESGDGPVHRVLPHAGASLCFRCRRSEGGRVLEGGLAFIGPVKTVRLFEPEPGLHLEAVRLEPGLGGQVLDLGEAEHMDGQPELVGRAARRFLELRDRLLRTRGPEEALTLLLQTVGRRLEECLGGPVVARGGDPTLARIVSGIRRRATSRLALPTVAAEAGVSERQVRRRVLEQTGFTPRGLHRIERLNRAVMAADRSSRQPNWARLAVQHGFSDQSHLIRETRDLAGRTPVELRAERALQRILPPG